MSEPTTPQPEAVPANGPAILAKKLAAILGEVSNVPKRGENKFHGYKFITESDLADAIRGLLAKHNVMLLTSVEDVSMTPTKTENGKEGFLTSVKTKHVFVCGDSGAHFQILGSGQGSDRLDKGVYKAITGAMKYVLMKNFLVSSNDDPEYTTEQGEDKGYHREGGKAENPRKPAGTAQKEPPAEEKNETPPMPELTLLKGVKWQDVRVHYGKNGPTEINGQKAEGTNKEYPDGVPLGKLTEKQLDFYADKFVLKLKGGKYLDDDVVFRSALNAYVAERDAKQKK